MTIRCIKDKPKDFTVFNFEVNVSDFRPVNEGVMFIIRLSLFKRCRVLYVKF